MPLAKPRHHGSVYPGNVLKEIIDVAINFANQTTIDVFLIREALAFEEFYVTGVALK